MRLRPWLGLNARMGLLAAGLSFASAEASTAERLQADSTQPAEAPPQGGDVQTLTEDGSAVGPLKKLRVPDKYTAFDVYADWCGPCRVVDRRLREIVAQRKDLAVRRLNVVDFDSPLAQELGPRFDTLPYVVVFSPSGKRTDVVGANLEKLDAALGRKK